MEIEQKIMTIGIVILIIIGVLLVGTVIYSMIEQFNYDERVGIIVDKQYNAAYSYTEITTSHIGNDTIRIPTTKYREAQYLLKLEKEIDGKKKNIWIEVPENEYEKYKRGDFYGE